ncbi:uncharacterized mitochondrial protein-like protein [Tanacetum coccineum]
MFPKQPQKPHHKQPPLLKLLLILLLSGRPKHNCKYTKRDDFAEELVLAALHQTQTWDLVPLQVGKLVIGSRRVYKIKTKTDGSIERRSLQAKKSSLWSQIGTSCLITEDDSDGTESLKLELAHRFVMKDLGLLCYFLGIEILEYLWATQFHTLLFSSTSALNLRAYCDSDWAGDSCQVVAVTTSEIVWLRWLLADMGVPISHSTPLHCDNRSAIHIARNSVFHEGTKHIEIDFHFTRHHLQVGTISLSFLLLC